MEFLVEFDVNVAEVPASDMTDAAHAEAAAAVRLVKQGHLVRLWRPAPGGDTKSVGLYRADSCAQLDSLLSALPMYRWMQVTVTPLLPHPNDPVHGEAIKELHR